MSQYASSLLQIIDRALPDLKGVSAEEMRFRPGPDKWSKKEILGHLIDSAYNNHQRFLRAASQDDLVFFGYDQVAWVVKNGYQNREEAEIVETWYQVNQHLSFLLEELPQSLLDRQTDQHNFDRICMNRIPKGSISSLGYLIWDYLFHLEHHLQQLIPGYQKQLAPFH